jgi:hydroxyacid-oxoacid transhydrogenase
MHRLNVPDGLEALGYSSSHMSELVDGTLPQHRVTKLAPRPTGAPELEDLFADSMKLYK